MHRLSSSFILGYHGCDRTVGERLLAGEQFQISENSYDWLGPGVYFWEADPARALDFAKEARQRKYSKIRHPFVIGAVLDLGLCLDLTTKPSLDMLRSAYDLLRQTSEEDGTPLPSNSTDLLRRTLDCAVIRRLHSILGGGGSQPIDSVKGVFIEGNPIYPGAGFMEKTHVQVAICNLEKIKAVFRVDPSTISL